MNGKFSNVFFNALKIKSPKVRQSKKWWRISEYKRIQVRPAHKHALKLSMYSFFIHTHLIAWAIESCYVFRLVEIFNRNSYRLIDSIYNCRNGEMMIYWDADDEYLYIYEQFFPKKKIVCWPWSYSYAINENKNKIHTNREGIYSATSWTHR